MTVTGQRITGLKIDGEIERARGALGVAAGCTGNLSLMGSIQVRRGPGSSWLTGAWPRGGGA